MKKHDASSLRFETIPASDGQTDRQTRRCRKDRAMHSVARVKSESGDVTGRQASKVQNCRRDVLG